MEAHGGYTFCGLAALVILQQEHLLNLRSLLVSGSARAAPQLPAGRWGRGGSPSFPLAPAFVRPAQHWVTGRQMRFEGGFQGRCNKLVDGCYSFWQAGLLPLLHRALHASGEPTPEGSPLPLPPRMASPGRGEGFRIVA